VTHILVSSAPAWGTKYTRALNQVLDAWKDYRAKHTVQHRGELECLAQEFMQKEGRALLVTMTLLIQDLRLDDSDVEDMLVDEASSCQS